MADAFPLGRSVREAVRMLEGIHEDVYTLLNAMDQAMADEQWFPFEKGDQRGKITDDLSNGLRLRQWLIKSVYRIYAPSRNGDASDRVAAVHIEFDPPDPCDEPTCLAVAAQFATPLTFRTVWNDWHKRASRRAMSDLFGTSGPQPLTGAALHDDFFPKASAGRAFVVPLCAVDGPDALANMLVKPMLKMTETM